MENLVGAETPIIIRGASGKLGAQIKRSLDLKSISSISLNRDTVYNSYRDPMLVLDFAGPNPKNYLYWKTFDLNKFLDEYRLFLEWVKSSHSLYIRIGSFGEFDPNPTQYENIAKEISNIADEYLATPGNSGLILYPSNIYGRSALGNIVEVIIESCLQKETFTPLNPNKLVNFIHFDDLVNFLVDMINRVRLGENIGKSLALISEANYSVSDLNDYISSQAENFDPSRLFRQESMFQLLSSKIFLDSVGIRILPNQLKNYIDIKVMNGLEFDIHA